MILRKIIGFGKNSHIITLPKKWLSQNSLKKGDILSMTEEKNGLLVTNTNKSEIPVEKEITIDATGKEFERLKAEIHTAYIQSCHTIKIKSQEVFNNVQEIMSIIRGLAGLEVVGQTSREIIANDLIDIEEVSVKTLVRRMDIIIRSMIEDTIQCIELEHQQKIAEQKALAENINHRDLDVNRLYFLAYRVIRRGLGDIAVARNLELEPLQMQDLYVILVRLERIADQAKAISNDLLHVEIKGTTKKLLQDLLMKISKRYEETMKAYYKSDKETAIIIELETDAIFNEMDSSFKTFLKQTLEKEKCRHIPELAYGSVVVSRIIDAMKIMARETRNVARVVMGFD